MDIQEPYKMIADCLPDPAYVRDRDMNILYMNPAAEKFTGYSLKDARGQKCYAVFGGARFACRSKCPAQRTTIEECSVLHHLSELKNQAGEVREMRITFSPFQKKGEVDGAVVLMQDITDLSIRTESHIQSIDQPPDMATELKHRNAFEPLISRILSELAGAGSGDIDAAIAHGLASIGTFTQSDRAYVYQYPNNGVLAIHSHEWCADGVESQIAENNVYEMDKEFPWLSAQLRNHETIHIPDVNALPNEAGPERSLFTSLGVKSAILVPMVLARELRGFLGFSAVRNRRLWSEEDQEALSIFSNTVCLVLERQRIETAHEKLRREMKNAIEMARLGPYEYDVTRDLFTCHDSFYKIFRTTAEKVGGNTMSSAEYAKRFVHPDDGWIMSREIQIAKETTGRHLARDVDTRILYADGGTGHAKIRYYLDKDDRGKSVKAIGVIQDITEQKLAEEALRESEARFRVLAENMKDMFWVVDYTTRKFLYVSPACRNILGYGPEEMVGKVGATFTVPTSLKGYRNRLSEAVSAVAAGKSYEPGLFEHEMIRKDGSTIWTETTFSLNLNAEGRVVSSQGVTRDVSERKKAEAALRESEERFRVLAENMKETFWVLDARTFKLTYVSPAVKNLAGFDPEEIIGWSCKDLITSGYPVFQAHINNAIKAAASGKSHGIPLLELGQLRKDGKPSWIEASFSLNLNEKGQVVSVQGVSRDITDRKKAEMALRDSEERFRAMAENMKDIFWIVDINTRKFLYVSPGCKEMTGFSPDEMVGKPAGDFVIPESLKRMRSTFTRAFTAMMEGESYESKPFDFIMICKDGSTVWTETNISLNRDNKGRIVNVQGVTRDISERKKAEMALRESEERFRVLAENMKEIFWVVDAKTWKVLYASPAAKHMAGYAPEELVGRPAKDFISSDYAEFQAHINKAITAAVAGQPYDLAPIEVGQLRKDGKTDWMETSLSLNLNEAGQVVSIQGVSRDITDRKRAEKALQESEERFRVLAENMKDMFWVVDTQTGKYLYVSPACMEIVGYRPEEMVGKIASDYVSPGAKKRVRDEWNKRIAAASAGTTFDWSFNEIEMVRKDGSNIWVEATISLNLDGEGHVVAVQGVTRDISERKKAEFALRESEEKLARAKKMESLGLLAGGVAHDLNNILSGIVSYPELLLMTLPANSELRDPLKTILASGQKAAAIVQDLLTTARGVAATRQLLCLNDFIQEYLGSPEFEKLQDYHPAVTFESSLEADLLNIHGSPVHVQKIVMNLISNAAEAIKGKGHIVISTENRCLDRPIRGYENISAGEYAVLRVSDNGPGISPKDMERIFEPFYSKKVLGRSGTGLGLAVVWNVVQEHNGYIDVFSDQSGTTFELYFPITRDKIVETGNASSLNDCMGKGESVLVVDDVDIQREITRSMLEFLGYQATDVSSGEAAVEYLRENTVDVIVLDMIMEPGISGRETYKRIKRIHPGQKAVIVSGFSETEEVTKTQQMGAGPYVKKPIQLDKLALAIKHELEK